MSCDAAMKNFVFVQTIFIPLQGDMQNTATWISSFFSKWITKTEIWKQIPPDEPYCVLLGSESDRHTDVLDAITKHLGIGSYREWSEEHRQEWFLTVLGGKRPLFGPDLPKTEEIAGVLDTFHVIAELPPDNVGELKSLLGRSTCVSEHSRVLQPPHLAHGMHPPISPESEWRALMDEMEIIATKEHRSIVFQEPRFVEYLHFVSI
ncbi:hypothetical protein POTOM_047061 [Populus tomentosa]|uniref:Uncharacterized protein n=1 Tax=Populus tomentosa TaxID=118781 RepID=A0A8X7YC02_POPTO|nr:hypothetical protein POTOM_047061 [Populus tomentosa]